MTRCNKCKHRRCRCSPPPCVPRYECDNIIYVDCCKKKNDKYGGCEPLENIKTFCKKPKPVPECQIPPMKFCLPRPGSVTDEVYFKMMEQIVDAYRKINYQQSCKCIKH